MTARPMASPLRARPGPDVEVTPSEPEKDAPMAEHTPRYLIFHLAGFHSQVLALCKFMENVGGWGYGVAPEEKGATRFFRSHYEAPCRGFVTFMSV